MSISDSTENLARHSSSYAEVIGRTIVGGLIGLLSLSFNFMPGLILASVILIIGFFKGLRNLGATILIPFSLLRDWMTGHKHKVLYGEGVHGYKNKFCFVWFGIIGNVVYWTLMILLILRITVYSPGHYDKQDGYGAPQVTYETGDVVVYRDWVIHKTGVIERTEVINNKNYYYIEGVQRKPVGLFVPFESTDTYADKRFKCYRDSFLYLLHKW